MEQFTETNGQIILHEEVLQIVNSTHTNVPKKTRYTNKDGTHTKTKYIHKERDKWSNYTS